tara:strand:- start:6554 stop:7039 length:486 start_codon:yes stop_codon:yes gene_type:complete
MPFSSNATLPNSVKSVLPTAAQNIYRRAFNAASKENTGASEEKLAKIAWGAVKNAGYSKDGDKWIKTSLNVELKVVDYSWTERVFYLSCPVPIEEFQGSSIYDWELASPFVIYAITEVGKQYVLSAIALETSFVYISESSNVSGGIDCTNKIATQLSLTLP